MLTMRELHGWVADLQAGDDGAWKEFIQVFSRFVPLVAGRLGLTAEEKEEVLQEMTLTAYRSIRNLRDPERLSSWTYTIARRAAITMWRSKKRHPSSEHDEEAEFDRLPSGEPSVDTILIDHEESRRLREAVATLRPLCRGLIDDLFLKEPRRSYQEVSQERGMPMGSIGPTLARCLQTLRQAWKSVSNAG
jgi:RNA polymerase sigma factor (sigma-70 family)